MLQNSRRKLATLARISLLAATCCSLQADTLNVGFFSFDVLIPGGATPGINGFTIANFTESFSLPPDFPVATPLQLSSAVVTLFFEGGLVSSFPLGTLGPGFYIPDSLQFPETDTFLSATFSADVSQSSVIVDGGAVLNVLTPHIQVNLVPSSGSILTAGADYIVFSIEARAGEQPEVPEPATVWGVGCALIAWWTCRIRRHRNEKTVSTPDPRSLVGRL